MNFNSFNRGLALSVAALALTAGASVAAERSSIFGGGSTLSEKVDRQVMDCLGTPIAGEANVASCTTPSHDGFEYYYAGIGSGTGLSSLLAEAAQAHSLDGGITSTDANQTTYPYPHWDLSGSDAPLDSLPTPTSALMYLDQYNASATKTNRGAVWQFPIGATSMTIPVNSGSSTVSGQAYLTLPASASGVPNAVQLDMNQLCYIWTGYDAKGVKVTGAYDWTNPLLQLGVTKGKSAKVIDNPAYTKYFVNGGSTTMPIFPVHRSDGSGSTFILTSFLKANCKGYATAGYGTPTNSALVFPANNPGGVAYSTSNGNLVSGSSAMTAAVNANLGAVGYVTPDQVQPINATGPIAAQIATLQSKAPSFAYVYPTSANVNLAVAATTPPVANKKPTDWGAKLNAKYFKKANNSTGYPITSLTWLMGYQCYVNDTTSGNVATAITNFASFLWATDASNGNAPTQADNIITANGLVPLPDTYKTSILGTIVTGSTKFAITPVVTTYSDKKGNGGPKACTGWNTDTNRL
jgi:ABC-type phosphate transport system substrate-binding protein